MRWPWVSRMYVEQAFTTHICTRDQLDARIVDLKAALAAAELRHDALLEKYHALRIEGSVMHPSVPAGVSSDAVERAASAIIRAAEPDELKSLIHDLCGTDYRKRAMMLRQLAADRASGAISDDRLRALIVNGIQGDGVPS